tara:strand:- start:120 stop:239 length:120 start_codon:yes stop_codon:yes gene_type:complete
LEEAWSLDNEDRQLLLESFEDYVKAKNPTAKGKMTQEQL